MTGIVKTRMEALTTAALCCLALVLLPLMFVLATVSAFKTADKPAHPPEFSEDARSFFLILVAPFVYFWLAIVGPPQPK